MVAAVTTSLPEHIGGERNWDYRYCWLRDAAFTLLAFMNAGFMEEANVWQHWLMRVIAGAPPSAEPLGRLIHTAARCGHLALYALMIALPVSAFGSIVAAIDAPVSV